MIGDNVVQDTENGFFLNINSQIEMACQKIKADPNLKGCCSKTIKCNKVQLRWIPRCRLLSRWSLYKRPGSEMSSSQDPQPGVDRRTPAGSVWPSQVSGRESQVVWLCSTTSQLRCLRWVDPETTGAGPVLARPSGGGGVSPELSLPGGYQQSGAADSNSITKFSKTLSTSKRDQQRTPHTGITWPVSTTWCWSSSIRTPS